MSGLEQAAQAFDTDLNGGGSREVVSTDTVFGNSFNGVEVDDGSPAIAGGDLTLPEGVDPNLVNEELTGRRRRPAREDDAVDPWSDDVLYADDDEEKAGPDDDEDEGDEDGEEADLDSKVTVTIDGEEKEVSVREALDGYIRTETFHKRMTELDQGRQEVEAFAHQVVASRKEASEALSLAEEILNSVLPKITQGEWDVAFAKDPAKARAMQRSYDEIQKKIDGVKSKRSQVDQGTNQQQIQQTNQWISREAQKFNDANPQWSAGEEGAKKRQKDLSSMARTAKAVGFEEQEILGVYDSRMLKVLLKASRYDRMMAARPKPGNGIKTARPGAGRSPTAPRGISRAAQNLQRTGSVEALGQVFTEVLNNPPRKRRR
jgi:hypothetical protein